MLDTQTSYHRPHSAHEAVGLLASVQGAVVLGGGTLRMGKLLPERPAHLIDLVDAGLGGVTRTGQRLRLGAMVTMWQLARDPQLAGQGCAALRDMALHFVPEPIARQATVGGNLWTGVGSLVAPLLLLDAQAVVLGPDGERHAPIAPLQLLPGELVVAIELEISRHCTRSAAHAVRRTPVGPALAVVALAEVKGQLRLAVSGLEFPARRLSEVEGPLRSASAAGWGQRVAEAVRPIDDARGSAAYRRAMAEVLTRRAVAPWLADSPAPAAVPPASPEGG